VANAQSFFNKGKFGKNRVQYQRFDWQYITTNNFEVYYYEGGLELAQLAAQYAEEDFVRITDMVGFSPYNKTKLFIYQSITDLQQSNIGITNQGLSVGGQTRFVRSEVEVPFTGNRSQFKKEIAYGIADVLIFEMMYGGNLKEVLSSNYLLRLPEWFMAGAAKYIAEGWSIEMDDYMRDLLSQKSFPKPHRMRGEEAAVVGQSIWNFIAEEYGKTNVSSVLNLTRIVRNEKSSIQGSLGITYENFIQQWRNYYLQQLATTADQHTAILKSSRLRSNRNGVSYNKLKISPNGKWIAFTENSQGKVKVKVQNLENKRTKTIFTSGYRVLNQRVDKELPLIGWRNDEQLIVIGTKSGKLQMFVKKPFELDWKFWRKNQKTSFENFNHIKDFSVSVDESDIVMSAEKNGQNDLYLLDINSGKIEQLTKDLPDDLNPRFMPDGKSIVFSSNRKTDSLQTAKPLTNIGEYFNIFSYRIGKKQLSRVTNILSNDILPIPTENGDILYLSDQKGIFHLFKKSMRDSINTQLTNYPTSINDYDYSADKFVLALWSGRREYLYKDSLNLSRNIFTGKTARQQKLDLRIVKEIRKQRAEEEAKVNPTVEEKKQEVEELAEDEIDTDNYQFDSFSKGKRKSFLDRFKSKVKEKEKEKEFRISAPKSYEQRFTADNFVTSLVIDPLRGGGLLFEVGMTDALENHKIDAGLFFQRNLNNSNFFAEYKYLKHRFDFGARFERNSLQTEDEATNGLLARNSLDFVELSASYPLSVASRFTIAPFFASSRFTDLNIFNSLPEQVKEYVGFNAEFVFDNSIVTSLNMQEGSKLKIRYENYQNFKDNNLSFGNIMVDARNYTSILRNLILASRVSYGSFLGNNKKYYMVGGMDNWVNQQINQSGNNNPLDDTELQKLDKSNLFFSRFITNIRGFDLNKLYGSDHLVFNAELRFPIIRALYQGTINSNFFRNLQFVAFTDVGAAWTGIHPFTQKNALNTEIIKGGPFDAKVYNFKDPFLVGYGFGMRSTMLGHYVKFDFAWGVEDGKQSSSPKFYLTLGYDF
jgi:hypothetical protein